MNLDNWIRLREHLAAQPDEAWCFVSFCGTACCLAGHACLMEGMKLRHSDEIKQIAAEILGIDWDDDAMNVGPISEHVFYGRWQPVQSSLTKDEALSYLDKAIAARDPLVRIEG